MGFFDKPFVADANEANTGGEWKPLPEGIYKLVIEKVEIKETKKKDGQYLAIQYKVDGGDHDDAKVYGNVTLDNPSAVAVDIGKKQLHALLILAGLKSIEHPDDILGAALTTKVVVKERTDKPGTFNNEVILAIEKGKEVTPTVASKPNTTAPRVDAKAKW